MLLVLDVTLGDDTLVPYNGSGSQSRLPRANDFLQGHALAFPSTCGEGDLRIQCLLWSACSVIGISDGVSTEHEVVRRIVFVHDTLHENHARMRRIQNLFQLAVTARLNATQRITPSLIARCRLTLSRHLT